MSSHPTELCGYTYFVQVARSSTVVPLSGYRKEFTLKLVTREQWGARPPRNAVPRIPGPVSSVTFHYEGPKMGSFDHSRCPGIVRGIQNFHMDGRGWLDIAYNALACPHEYVFEGRWIGARSAANGSNDGNSTSYAVCAIMGAGDPLTNGHESGLLDSRTAFIGAGAGTLVFPHQHWFNTSCPGQLILDWIKAGFPDPRPSPHAPEVPNVPADMTPSDKCVRIYTRKAGGVWTVAADGGLFNEGGAPFFGSLGGVRLNAPVVAFCVPSDEMGYWMISADGGIFTFGSAKPVPPYQPFMKEYANGVHRITDAVALNDKTLVLMSNLGERYTSQAA